MLLQLVLVLVAHMHNMRGINCDQDIATKRPVTGLGVASAASSHHRVNPDVIIIGIQGYF